MVFDMKTQSPIFLKLSLTKSKKKHLSKISNEFASTLNNEQSALLLDWIGSQIRKKMEQLNAN
jgi:hypothetical protein